MAPYESLPSDSLTGPTRDAMPPGTTPEETRAMLHALSRYPVYGLMFCAGVDDPVTKLLASRWDALNHMTGAKFLLIVFQPPERFSEDYEAFCRQKLGDDFQSAWDNWRQRKSVAYRAYDFADMFADQHIARTMMPCLALFTEPDSKQAAVVPMPQWSDDDTWAFLTAICDIVDQCGEVADPKERLDALRKSLTSFPARTQRTLGHLAKKAEDYVKANPAKVATTTLSIVIALATANIVPLGAGVVAFLKDIKEAVKPAPAASGSTK